MTLDVRTLFIIAVPAAFLFFAVQLAVWSARRNDQALLLWAMSNLLGGLGAIAVALRPVLDERFAIPISQTLILGGLCLSWAGMRSFAQRPFPSSLIFFLLAVNLAGVSAAPFLSDSFTARTMITSTLLGVVNLIIAYELLADQRHERLRARSVLAAIFAAQGLFYLYRTWEARHYSPDAHIFQSEPLQAMTLLVGNLKLIAWNIVALLMANERLTNRLVHAASCDALTNVLNRAGFRELSGRQIQRSQQSRSPASVLLMDIDHFKKVNDRYGHEAGDRVLCQFADTVRQALRPTDLLARHGGEEFCALLPDSDAATAQAVAERVRASFEKSATSSGGIEIRATVSIGVAQLNMPDEQIQSALARADAALYQAKDAGQNRVMLAAA